jgi:hypothetical protein
MIATLIKNNAMAFYVGVSYCVKAKIKRCNVIVVEPRKENLFPSTFDNHLVRFFSCL